MKFLHLALLSALLCAPTARAEENRYDLLGRLLQPFFSVFAETTKSPNRAFRLTGKLEALSEAPSELLGSKAELAVEYPDKLRLHAPVLGEDLTICRHGQEIWVYPGSKVEALLALAKSKKKLPKVDKDAPLGPFSLPIPEQQLALLPILFQVKDVGSEPLDGESCRVLDVYLMPELGKALKAKDWASRVWVRGDGKPARLSLARAKWNLVVRFSDVEFAPILPPATWEPTADQSADVLKLDPKRYQQLLGALFN